MLNAHIEELSERHRVLDKKIEEEMARPSVDTLKITELKRLKLRLKDKIASLEKASAH